MTVSDSALCAAAIARATVHHPKVPVWMVVTCGKGDTWVAEGVEFEKPYLETEGGEPVVLSPFTGMPMNGRLVEPQVHYVARFTAADVTRIDDRGVHLRADMQLSTRRIGT